MINDFGSEMLSVDQGDGLLEEQGKHSEGTTIGAPEAFIVHSTINRLRLRIPSKRGDYEYFQTISDKCSNFPETITKANPLTGSLLIVHTMKQEDMIALLNKLGMFRIKTQQKSKGKLHRDIESVFAKMDKGITKATGGELNLTMLTFLTLAGAGIFQIARGNFNALPWYTALWYAASLFRKAKVAN